MSRTEKISITLDADLLAQIRKRARAEKTPLSALINETLANELRRQALRVALDAFEKEHGAFTVAEREWARARLEEAWGKKRRKRRAA